MRLAEELIDRLAEERIWRIKEISTVTTLASRSGLKPVETEFYCRAGAALFYSHWEGFVKRAGAYYLRHIAYQRIAICDMADFVLAIYMAQAIGSGGYSVSRASALGDTLLRKNDYRPKLRWKDVVKTDSNLSSVVFRRIVNQIGIDPVPFASKEKFIDGTILKHRNSISHGEKGEVDLSTLSEIGEQVVTLISMVRDAIENAAALRQYVR